MIFIILLLIIVVLWNLPQQLNYSYMTSEDILYVDEMETQSYASIDEKPGIIFKQFIVDNCPELSLVTRNRKGEIIGVMYAGLVKGTSVTNEKIRQIHDPFGDTLMVHSQCVRNDMRGRGIGRKMVRHYYDTWVRYDERIKYAATCIRKKHLRWMESLGYSYVGPSEISLGTESWIDIMRPPHPFSEPSQ